MSKWMTRKEIAQVAEISVAQVRKGEARFGLLPHKRNVARSVRYVRAGVLRELELRGML